MGAYGLKEKMLPAKERMLLLMQILQKYTDTMRGLTIHELLSHFPKGKAGLKGLRSDLDALEASTTFTVVTTQEKEGMPKYYHYDGRYFEVHELRLLMDAISSAKFISERETASLLMKIRSLTSDHLGKQLTSELQNMHKAKLQQIETTYIENLHAAIHEEQVVTFQYGDYTTDLQFTLRRDGEVYEVHPHALIWDQDRYYLIAYSLKDDEVRHYRVDRMRNVEVLEETFVKDGQFSLQEHLKNSVHMYNGDEISLEAEFHNRLMNTVVDRFGLNINVTELPNERFNLKVRVANSRGLRGWLLRWGSEVKVLYPPFLVEEMKREIEQMKKLYE